jgi:hypothetical protein
VKTQAIICLAAVVAFFKISASRAAPDDSTEGLQRSVQALHAWRLDDALEASQTLPWRYEQDGLSNAALGELRFHLGDYEGATLAFQAAEAAAIPEESLPNLPYATQAAQETKGFETAFDANFLVRYPPGPDAVLVDPLLETLQAALPDLGTRLGFLPKARILVEIYPNAATLAKVSPLTQEEIETSGTIALCRWNRLMVTSPRAVIHGYGWRDTLAHELAHLVIGGASHNQAPIWLQEGLAKHLEGGWRHRMGQTLSPDQVDRLLQATKSGTLISFKRMHPSMARLSSQEEASLAFAEVSTFVAYLVEKNGWEAIQALLRRLGGGESMHAALRASYGVSFVELEKDWKRRLTQMPAQRLSAGALSTERIVLKDSKEAKLPSEKQSQQARIHLRAADLLYARGRLAGAQRELERAEAISNAPVVSARLARVALLNNDLVRADASVQKALLRTPDAAGLQVTLAEIAFKRQQPEEALRALDAAININPFDPRIYRLTLSAAGEAFEPAHRRARAALLALEQPSGRSAQVSLGQGGRVHILSPRFARVFLRRSPDAPWITTGRTTPLFGLELQPGRWELMLLPPSGDPLRLPAVVQPAGSQEAAQTIDTESNS